jgi:chromosome segregation ATPase
LDATVVNDLVEGIIKSRIADSEASFEERNNILSLLKANVEYAQSCHNSLLEVKSVYNKQLEEKGAVEAKKMEKTTSLSQWNSLLDENKKAIAELEQKLEQLRLEGQKIKKEIEHEESELSRLQEVDNSIEKACDDAQRLFRSILAELELKMLNAPSFVNR